MVKSLQRARSDGLWSNLSSGLATCEPLQVFEWGVVKSLQRSRSDRLWSNLSSGTRHVRAPTSTRVGYGQISPAGSPRASPYRYSNRMWLNLTAGGRWPCTFLRPATGHLRTAFILFLADVLFDQFALFFD